MADEITMRAINLLRQQDPNLDEMSSMDKFLQHQFELASMRDQYVSYSNHPQADKMKKRLEVFEDSSMAFTWVYFTMMQYKRELVLSQSNEMEMANAIIELKHELNILTKLKEG
jgi:hypothetical protein|tara:strand:+ start:511 stop:852 length:342 start_codon:yes stop_codon:yes gene_type:complete